MPDINKDLLLSRIMHSGDFTALEKRFLECLVQHSRTGQWIEDEYGFFHCSVCGWEFGEPEQTEPKCPNCGAKMTNHRADEPVLPKGYTEFILGKFYERR